MPDYDKFEFFSGVAVLITKFCLYLQKIFLKQEEDKDFFGDEEIKDDEGIMESDVADDSDE